MAPLRLHAITLHGIGSYRTAARLEIRPLTILCGTNGSGKSTWIKILTLLKECAQEATFPFNLYHHASRQGWCLLNAFVAQKDADAAQLIDFLSTCGPEDPLLKAILPKKADRDARLNQLLTQMPWSQAEDAALSGPPGTIALEFDCVRKMNMPAIAAFDSLIDHPDIPDGIATGRFKRGDRIAIRITPSVRTKEMKSSSIFDCTLLVNDRGLSFSGQIGAGDYITRSVQRGADGKMLFASFTAENNANVELLGLGLFERIRQLVSTWATGYFHIGAIREILAEEKFVPEGEKLSLLRPELEASRWVGAKGEHTHALRALFAFNPVLDPRQGRPYTATLEAPVPPQASEAEPSTPDTKRPVGYYWPALAYPVVWQQVARQHPAVWRSLVDALAAPQPRKLPDYPPLIEFASLLFEADKSGKMEALAAFFREKESENREEKHTCTGMNTTPHAVQTVWTAPMLWPRSQRDVEITGGDFGHLPGSARQSIKKYVSQLPVTVKGQKKKLKPRPQRPGETDYLYRLAILATSDPSFRESLANPFDAGKGGDHPRRSAYAAAMLQLGTAVVSVVNHPLFLKSFIASMDQGDWPGVPSGAPSFLRFLASLPPDQLPTADRDWCIDWILSRCSTLDYRTGDSLRMGTIFGYWMHRLAATTAIITVYGDETTLAERGPYVGYMSSCTQEEYHNPFSKQQKNLSNAFIDGDPADYSSGFHQLAPILTQTGLMRMNEILAIENPEVHLHPKLQLDFTEFFIENAAIGKFFLVETHSDLVVRRIWRAVVEGRLHQSWVGLNFVRPVEEKQSDGKPVSGSITSVVERLKLDRLGRIANWPEGFLDDDESESLAMMQAMCEKNVDQDDEG